jgi:hypothetical protein
MNLPDWLPKLFNLDPWSHDTYNLLYQIFHADFIANKTYYRRTHVQIPKHTEEGKEITFWHITTRHDKNLDERLPDFRRCERLPWLKPILTEPNNSEILTWENEEGGGSLKVYVWLKNHDYIAIMKRTRKGQLILITAYWIEYSNARQKLMKKYNFNKKANA